MAKIILASQSPRRKQLMELAEIEFEIIVPDIDETPPPGLHNHDVPAHLAKIKAEKIAESYKDAIIIAADTIVVLDDEIIGKPKDEDEAKQILAKLSGREHQVVTGVHIIFEEHRNIKHTMTNVSMVTFRKLSQEQIDYYVTKYKPLDKAGAYAIQEWIGVVGIEKIRGDYYSIMGLPIGNIVESLNNPYSMEEIFKD